MACSFGGFTVTDITLGAASTSSARTGDYCFELLGDGPPYPALPALGRTGQVVATVFMLAPVAEHVTYAFATVHLVVVAGESVRVAVDHGRHIMAAERGDDRILVHVHDLQGLLLLLRFAA